MKKLAVLVLFLCAASWGVATYVIGGRVENEYHRLIGTYGRWGPVTLTSVGYQRGFFSSRAITELTLAAPAGSGPGGQGGSEPVRVAFEHTLYHGPLLIGGPLGGGSVALAMVDTGIVFPEGEGEEFREMLREVPELAESFARVRFGFDGKVRCRAKVPPFLKEKDGATITFDGLTVNVDYAPGDGSLVGNVAMPNLDVRLDGGSMRWNGLSGSFDLVEALPGLFVGPSRAEFGGMEIDFVNVKSGQRERVAIRRIDIASDSSHDGSMVHASQVMSFGGVTVGGETYGPLEIDMDIRNMDGQVLSSYQTQVMAVYRRANQSRPEEMFSQLLPVYSDLATRLLAGSPEFNIRRFYVNTPKGEAHGTLQLSYDHPQRQVPPSPAALPQYLRFFDADLDLEIDQVLARAVLKSGIRSQLERQNAKGNRPAMSQLELDAMVNQQAERQLQAFAREMYIVRAGKTIKSRLVLRDGRLLVNGKPLPVFEQ